MGGRLFNKSKVLFLEEYTNIREEIGKLISSSHWITPIEYLKSKISFNDIDIPVVVKDPYNFDDEFNEILAKLQPSEVSGYSILYKGAQVDFIPIAQDSLSSELLVLNIPVFHIILGKLARRYGVRLTKTGVTMTIKYDGEQETINITRTAQQTLELFQLDIARYYEGFNNVEEVFDYIMSSPYYSSEWAEAVAAHGNSKDRSNDAKYNCWTELAAYTPFKESKYSGICNIIDTMETYNITPSVKDTLEKLQDISRFKAVKRTVFNGFVIGDITGLKGKELGDFMRYVESRFLSEEDMAEFLQNVGDLGAFYKTLYTEEYEKKSND